MFARRVVVAVALAAAGLILATPMAAAADPLPPPPAVTMDEQDCLETSVARAVLTSKIDPLVPDRYALANLNANASRFIVTTYTCSQVSVEGQPVAGHDKPTTVTIGTAPVISRDGEQFPSQEQYIIWYGTDNPVLFAKLQQTGLPVSFLPRSSTTITSDNGITTVDWAIRGAELNYDERAVWTEQTTELVTPTTTWWHDGPKGDLRITYDNRFMRSTAVLTADFTDNDLLSDLIAQPTLLNINQVPFPFVRGSWSSQVSFVS